MKTFVGVVRVTELPACCGARWISGFQESYFILPKSRDDKDWDENCDEAKSRGHQYGSNVMFDTAYSKFSMDEEGKKAIGKELFSKMNLLWKQGVKTAFVATTIEQKHTNAVLEEQGFYTMAPYNRIIGWMITLKEWAEHNGLVKKGQV
jgi:hypothetical protein